MSNFDLLLFSSGCLLRLYLTRAFYSPAEDTKNEIEHEEGSNDDEWHKVDPVVGASEGVVRLSWSPV